MKLIVEMEKKWGGYNITKYDVRVFRDKDEVWMSFDNVGENPSVTQRGGSLWMPPDVARKLGYALLLGSSVEDLPDGIHFSIDEEKTGS
jgi:hypothetical protein